MALINVSYRQYNSKVLDTLQSGCYNMLEVQNPVDHLSYCSVHNNAHHILHLLAISLVYLKSKLSIMYYG